VAGKRQFPARREDTQTIVDARFARRKHEGRLGVVELTGDLLHPGIVEAFGVHVLFAQAQVAHAGAALHEQQVLREVDGVEPVTIQGLTADLGLRTKVQALSAGAFG
jgi:hypothetical protein